MYLSLNTTIVLTILSVTGLSIYLAWPRIMRFVDEQFPPAPESPSEPLEAPPSPPPPKSRRPEPDVLLEICKTFGPPVLGFFIPFALIGHLSQTVGWPQIIVSAVVATVVALINNSEFVAKVHLDAQRLREQKWAKEDADWAQYERDLKEWQNRQQLHEAVGPQGTSAPDAVSDIARKIVEEMRRGKS